jgi:hypothetical protein
MSTYDWLGATSSCTASNSRRSGYWTKYYNPDFLSERHEAISEAEKTKIDLEIYAKEFMQKMEQPPAYMRGVLGDFESQYNHDREEVEEPQEVFHFDPKGIVDKWPEKES